MGKYEDTLKDIETSIGFVPGFYSALAEERLGRIKNTSKVQGNDRISNRRKHKMSILYDVPYRSSRATWCQ